MTYPSPALDPSDEDLPTEPPPRTLPKVHHIPAGQWLLMAARVEAEAARSEPEVAAGSRQRAREVVEQVRTPIEHEPAIGGELIPADEATGALTLRDTLERPDAVAAEASRVRLELAHRAGVLETALDAADTMEASNSFEKMLTHQLGLMHHLTMKMGAQAIRHVERLAQANLTHAEAQRISTEAARLGNATSRMTVTYQQGMTTLKRLRTGGSQQVVVQHQYVTKVEDGGQAIVAAEVRTRGQRRKRKAKRGSGVRNER